jgi:hypothetical protein
MMALHTQIIMREDILKRIDAAARTLGVKRTHLIRLLLESVIENPGPMSNYPNPVLYQERSGSPGKQGVHMSIREEDYDRYLDLRNSCRMSLSLIVARAAMDRLDDMVLKIQTSELLMTGAAGRGIIARKRRGRDLLQ